MIELNATLVAQIINFLILVALLTKFAYKPLLKILAERQEKIAGNIAAAERERQEAETLRQDYLKQLDDARARAQSIVDKAAQLAEQTKDEILAAAREESTRLIKAAQEESDRQRDKVMDQMKADMVNLSLAAAAKIIQHNLDAESNAKLVDDFIRQLDDKKVGGLPC
ncbi:F0F1 ATP synthase subunit B [Azotosporobacter soli]|uniref:F0F1 ATP synthase subunit B n=1 Tax=Azotosporobacter soli TaxID=3055040 RepID=UPI0031FF4612